MERSTGMEQARFWRDSAKQLREIARTAGDKPTVERLRNLASEYERLAATIVPAQRCNRAGSNRKKIVYVRAIGVPKGTRRQGVY